MSSMRVWRHAGIALLALLVLGTGGTRSAHGAQLVASIDLPAGTEPLGVAAREATRRLYVTGRQGMLTIDTESRSVLSIVPGGLSPIYLWPAPDWTKLYVSCADEQAPEQEYVRPYDVSNNSWGEPFRVGPETYYMSAAFGPDGMMYVCNQGRQTEGQDYLLKVDPASHELLATVALGAGAQALVITPDGAKAYVGSWDMPATSAPPPPNHMYVVSLSSLTVLSKIPIGVGPWAAALSPDGSDLYVVCTEAAALDLWHILVQTDEVNPNMPQGFQVGASPMDIVLSPTGTKAFICNRALLHGVDEDWVPNVAVVDLLQWQVLENVIIPSEGLKMALAPQSGLLYVTCFDADKIAVIDVSDHLAAGPSRTPTMVVQTKRGAPPNAPTRGVVVGAGALFALAALLALGAARWASRRPRRSRR